VTSQPDPRAAKRVLRRDLRTLRRALDPVAQAAASRAIAAIAWRTTAVAAARTIAAYVAHDGEPDLAAVLDEARRRGAAIVLPRLARDGGIELIGVAADGAALAPGASGIAEPMGAAIDPARLAAPAAIFVPAVALDAEGRRLGRGGGHYDRLLPALRRLGWTAIGVCHAAQLVARLPEEPHDARVDAILTERGYAPAVRGSARVGC
jgi:5-formyltetrahydrofolate cyclo-ligase